MADVEVMVPREKTKRKKCWSWHFGPRGHRWTVCEDTPGSNLYLSQPKSKVYRSLEHKDRERAKQQCREASVAHQASNQPVSTVLSIGQVLDRYLQQQTPGKVASEQEADRRRAAMWEKRLGRTTAVEKLGLKEWEDFKRDRSSGAVDAFGESPPADQRIRVREGTVAADLMFLSTCLTHATNDSTLGLKANPYANRRLYKMPKGTPRQPVITYDRHLKVMEAIKNTPKLADSYLIDFVPLIHSTGRRFSAVLHLRYRDLHLGEGTRGVILWPAEFDKMKRETVGKLDDEGRAAIDSILQKRPGIGAGFLFPDPDDSTKVISRDLMNGLYLEAEKIAGLPKLRGTLWHCYRRTWATERKPHPIKDVAEAGGWKGTQTVLNIYMQTDEASLERVVMEPQRLREVKKEEEAHRR